MSDAAIDTLGNNAQAKLKSLVERIERLNEDKAAVGDQGAGGRPRQAGRRGGSDRDVSGGDWVVSDHIGPHVTVYPAP